MSLIEGVGDEVTQFFIVLISVLVGCIAWWTTSISEQRQLRTVFLIDRQARGDNRGHNRPPPLNSEGVATMSEAPAAPAQEMEAEATTTARPAPRKPPEEAAGSSVDDQTAADVPASTNPETVELNSIVQAMDAAETNVLRERRTAFYSRHNTLIGQSGEGEPAAASSSTCEGIGKERPCKGRRHRGCIPPPNSPANSSGSDNTECHVFSELEDSAIKIKLKYINDDLKVVEGNLEDTVGEFKRQHFNAELNSNKIVRLIFNGRVLQPDTTSLESCGLFDNCVVHCLIHNKRPSLADSNDGTTNANDFMRRDNRQRMPHMNNNNNNNNNQGRESDLGNIFFALISFILGSAWYFRYVYAHLYTITATVALVAVTGIFSVVVIGMYFPDQEAVPQRRDNEQR